MLRAQGSPDAHTTSPLQALKKVVVGQVTLFPTYLAAFYMYMGALEGRPPQQWLDKIQASFAPSYITGSCYWPLVNVLTFTTIAPSMRVAWINGAGVAWNAYLSWANSTHGSLGGGATVSGGVGGTGVQAF